MKASVWFESQGRSLRSRGYNWHQAKVHIGLNQLPHWAKMAFARGHMYQALTRIKYASLKEPSSDQQENG
jgi:hypothetical protein